MAYILFSKIISYKQVTFLTD